jgi:hypothetical protein
VRIEGEKEVLDYLTKWWGEEWEIRGVGGAWVANRRRQLHDGEIAGGLVMSLAAEDLQSLHRLVTRQGRLKAELTGRAVKDV